MRQFFIDEKLDIGITVCLNQDIKHHLIDVLRFKDGDIIRLVDNTNQPYKAQISLDNNLSAKVIDKFESVEKK